MEEQSKIINLNSTNKIKEEKKEKEEKEEKEEKIIDFTQGLNEEQKSAFNKFVAQENLFITGPGGSGKTFLIHKIVSYCKYKGLKYQVCSLTACSAILLQCKAKTIHSWAGIGIAQGEIETVVERVVKNKSKRRNWNKTNILIVDEVSMLSLKLFQILDNIARKIKFNNSPFGNMQILFAGDFFQLPPIGDEYDDSSSMFCFESPLWNLTFKNTISLTSIFRQNSDIYKKILNNIRVGKITKSSVSILNERVGLICQQEIKPTILLPTRNEVNKINFNEYNKLSGEEKVFIKTKINNISNKSNSSNSNSSNIENELNYLYNNINAEDEISLKIGTLVMCIVNLEVDDNNSIVNGSQGIIIDFKNDLPVVKFNNGIIRTIYYHLWKSENIDGIGISQIPLIYAWAITIHKSQGLSIQNGIIGIGASIFECGQTYVALSRITSLEGLYLTCFDPSKIKVNKKVQEFYKSII